MSNPINRTPLDLDGLAAEAALGDFLDRLAAACPGLSRDNFTRLPKHEIDGLLRTAFFNGFAAGESA